MLGAGWVQGFVLHFVVGFLKQDIGANARIFQLFIVFHSGGRNVHIDTADGAVFMLDGVDGIDAFQHVFNRIIHRVFPAFQSQTLVTHVLKRNDFTADFVLRQLFTWNVLVF